MSLRSAFAAAVAALALGAAGCGATDVDKDDYVRQNLAVLRSIPAPPSTRLTEQVSRPYKESDRAGADVIGYWTIRTYATSRSITAREVVAFYRKKLSEKWRLLQQSAAPSLSYRKGDAYLHILVDSGSVVVEADHDCYKAASSPSCG